MLILGHVLSWILSLIFLVVAIAMFGMGGKLQGILVLGITLCFLPSFRKMFSNLIHKSLRWWIWGLTIVVLWVSMILSISLNPQTSIYKTSEFESKLMAIYDRQLSEWPVPYESVYVETDYGKVHVIVSGPEEAPPLLLIHASAMAGWSWLYNVAELNKHYRTYCVDSIGDIGKSVLNDLAKPLTGREAIGQFYSDLTSKLGFEKSYVAGASVGGYIATQYALHAPERIPKLALLGSMGYGHTQKTITLMIIATSFPFDWVRKKTSEWALGTDPFVQDQFGEWFELVLKGTMPKPTSPVSFTSEDLQNLNAPVFAFFGTKDQVIGDANAARELAMNMPNCQVELVESGHLVGAEKADYVNEKLVSFFGDEDINYE